MRIALVLAAALAASACGASIGDPANSAGAGGGGGDSSGGGGGGVIEVDAGGGNEIGPDASAPLGVDAAAPQPSVASAEDYLHGVFDQVCTEAFSCKDDYDPSDGDTFAEDWGTSVDNCIDEYDTDYGVGHINSDVTAGKAAFSASDASTCLASITFPTSCTDFFNGNYSFPATCGTALVGEVADGGACNCYYECSGANSYCPTGGGACTAQ